MDYASKGEESIARWLLANEYLQIPQKSFKGCKDNSRLRFDFYLPDLKILIEFDGEQHFRPIEHWGGEEAFKKTQKRDRIKTDWAKKNGYHLIRVKYSDDINEVLSKRIAGIKKLPDAEASPNRVESNTANDGALTGCGVIIVIAVAVWFGRPILQSLTNAIIFLGDIASKTLFIATMTVFVGIGILLVCVLVWFIAWNIRKIVAERRQESAVKLKGICPNCSVPFTVTKSNADSFLCPKCQTKIRFKAFR